MDKLSLKIIIFPDTVNVDDYSHGDDSIYGAVYSDLQDLRVNKIKGGYSILYSDIIFASIDPITFCNNVIRAFNSEIPNTIIEISIDYFINLGFNTECGLNVVSADDFFNDCENPLIEYMLTKSVEYLVDCYDEEVEDFDFEDYKEEDDDEDDYEDDEDDDDYENDDEEDFESIYHWDYGYDNYDNSFPFIDDRYYKKNKKKPKNNSYSHSKILTSSSKAKQNIKHHGILISSNKEARKKDEKTIRAFLKDFIPGNSTWEKEYRKEILNRWMTMYVMTKKVAKRMSKAHKEERRKPNRIPLKRDTAMNITKRFFDTVSDPFYDPTR